MPIRAHMNMWNHEKMHERKTHRHVDVPMRHLPKIPKKRNRNTWWLHSNSLLLGQHLHIFHRQMMDLLSSLKMHLNASSIFVLPCLFLNPNPYHPHNPGNQDCSSPSLLGILCANNNSHAAKHPLNQSILKRQKKQRTFQKVHKPANQRGTKKLLQHVLPEGTWINWLQNWPMLSQRWTQSESGQPLVAKNEYTVAHTEEVP